MGERRRIVPDASALLPAFFPEGGAGEPGWSNIDRRALAMAHDIRVRRVVAFAPPILLHEFTKAAHRKAVSRDAPTGVSLEAASERVPDFLSLPVTYQPTTGRVAAVAWDLGVNASIAPPDSWYLACAVYYDAEYWVSPEHADRLVANARAVHPKVYVLAEQSFR